MDKAKEIISDPAKLEEALKQAWKKLDPEGKGYATYDVVRDNLKAQAKALGIPEREPTPEEREAAKKLADPDGTGKVTFENFVKFIKCGIEQGKAKGKI